MTTSLRRHVAAATSDPQELVFAVALEDITAAADLLRPEWDRTGGVDGYVSIEVPPGLAYGADASIDAARSLHREADRPNVLVKIPGTSPGLAAMEQLITEGIGINVTLLFSDAHYLQTAEAYIRALQRRAAAGQSLDVPSVASVFVSRWDRAADALLPEDAPGRSAFCGRRRRPRIPAFPTRTPWGSMRRRAPSTPSSRRRYWPTPTTVARWY